MVLHKSWHHKELLQCSCGALHNDTRKPVDLGCPLASLMCCKRQRQRRDRTTAAKEFVDPGIAVAILRDDGLDDVKICVLALL